MAEQKYAVGTNMPGYMPDSDPSECESFAEAKATLLFEMEVSMELCHGTMTHCPYPEDRSDAAAEFAALEILQEQVKALAAGEYSAQAGNRVYWIHAL